MIVVTGGAGFIGSCIVAALNARGIKDIIIVDNLKDNAIKENNITNKNYAKYYDKGGFLELVLSDKIDAGVTHVIHMGACSSTTLTDADYYQKNNFEYSCHLAEWAKKRQAHYIYASSAATYGDGSLGYNDAHEMIPKLQPLNLYGDSKQRFDLWVMDNGYIDSVVGLKFFNVYGPNEYHKGDMRSVIAKTYQSVIADKKIGLFKSYQKPDYEDGGQKRDFIYVKDAVNVVMHFFDHPHISGIYNVGTGSARTWNDLALALFAAVDIEPYIEYIDMPENLRDKYQYFTQADMGKLHESGFSKDFYALEEGVKDYANYLSANAHW